MAADTADRPLAYTPTNAASTPGRDTPPDPIPVHEGHDWMYVLSGRMRLLLGDEDLVIEPGVEFSTLTPHWFGRSTGSWS